MSATIRQQYNHPALDARYVRDILIDVEHVRPDNSNEIASKIYIKVEPSGQNPPPDSIFPTIYVDPEELLGDALEGKRTMVPIKCNRSYLTKKIAAGEKVIQVFDNSYKGLNVRVGEPLVVLSDLDGSAICYSIVASVNNTTITLTQPLTNDFVMGAFVENLSHRWHKASSFGAKSYIKRPPPLPFLLEESDDQKLGIDVQIQEPMNSGAIKCADVYVRDNPFDTIEPHWMPDAGNLSLNIGKVSVFTYNGGEEAGGSLLTSGRYYVAVISKDKAGRIEVNESTFLALAYDLHD